MPQFRDATEGASARPSLPSPPVWLLAALLAAAPAGAARADWGGFAGYATRNLYRGMTLSAQHGAWMLDGHYRAAEGRGLIGVTALGVAADDDPGSPSPAAQLQAYATWSQSLSPRLRGTLGYTHYDAINRLPGYGLVYDEALVALQLDNRLSLSLSATPNLDLYDRHLYAYGADAVLRQPLAAGLSMLAGLGYYRAVVPRSAYGYGSLGLGYSWRRWQLTLQYVGNDARARAQEPDAYLGWVGTLTLGF